MSVIYKSEAAQQAVEAGYRRLLDAWPVPKEELRIATGQGETFVIACGPKDAPPLVAFHGAQANSTAWMFDCLAWSQDFRVYLVDVPGDAGFSAPERPELGSDAYVLWLDEVLAALGVAKTSLVGVSLGGWLALDYATRRPERVERLALLCPAGVGGQKNLLLKVLPLLVLGRWGRKKVGEMVFGSPPTNLPPAVQELVNYVGVIGAGARARPTRIPIFPDAALARLTMPVLAIVGGQDVLIDSAGTRDRLQTHAPGAQVIYLPQARHVIPGQTMVIHDFLRGAGMTGVVEEIAGTRVLVFGPDGGPVRGDRDAVDLIGEALGEGVTWVAVPVERLGDDFFRLSTRIAGEVIQKFVNYQRRLVVFGDISRHLEASTALRDFVGESNRGRHVWFVDSLGDLADRLTPGG